MNPVTPVAPPSVSSLSAVSPSTTSPTSGTAAGLSESQFFQLLSAELADQLPTDPASGTAFITQLAEFTQLSTLSSIQSELATLVQAEQAQSAPILAGAALLGKTVTTTQGTGVVQGAAVQSGTTYLTISGQSAPVPLSAVTAVAEPSAS